MISTLRYGALILLFTSPAFGAVIQVGAGQTFTTIQSGFAAASAGDTLLIDDGNYNFASTFNVTKSVTFQSVNVGGARISGGGTGGNNSIFFLSANNATFDGLYFSNSNSNNAIYQRNTGVHGIVRNSIFDGITTPLHINNSGGQSGSLNISNVTIIDANHGVNINDGGTVRITNSIIANTNFAYVGVNLTAIIPDSNLLFNVNNLVSGSNISADPSQINSDPMFVNAGAQDYRLLAGSPAIDSGVDLGQPFLGSAPDRGAFEFSAASAVPEPSSIALLGLAALLGLFAHRAKGKQRPQTSNE